MGEPVGADASAEPQGVEVPDPFGASPERVVEPDEPQVKDPEPLKRDGLVAAVDRMTALLETIVPVDGKIVVEDLAGNKYPLRGSIPAKIEQMVLRRLDALTKLDVESGGPEFVANMQVLISGKLTPGGMLATLLKLVVASDAILAAVNECFAMAHPLVIETARTRAGEDPETLASLRVLGVDVAAAGPSDLFSTIEVIRGLLPFVAKNARGLAETAKLMLLAS